MIEPEANSCLSGCKAPLLPVIINYSNTSLSVISKWTSEVNVPKSIILLQLGMVIQAFNSSA